MKCRSIRSFLTVATLLLVAIGTDGMTQAADYSDPDWPCIQRKVPHLSIGQMWAGPTIGEDMQRSWRDNPEVHRLASVLSLRRTPLETAEGMIADFAERVDLGKDRTDRLSILFAGIFALIERERTEIISGIARYAHKQDDLAKRIDKARDELTELSTAEKPDYDRIEALQDQVDWEARIFKDRSQSLRFVCETPVILEQRAFALARAIQQHLP